VGKFEKTVRGGLKWNDKGDIDRSLDGKDHIRKRASYGKPLAPANVGGKNASIWTG
jgi:hypothetical protein